MCLYDFICVNSKIGVNAKLEMWRINTLKFKRFRLSLCRNTKNIYAKVNSECSLCDFVVAWVSFNCNLNFNSVDVNQEKS